MSQIMQDVITNITQFLSGVGNIITTKFIPFITGDESGVMMTFVVAFPLCYLGVWLIKKIIRVKDTD